MTTNLSSGLKSCGSISVISCLKTSAKISGYQFNQRFVLTVYGHQRKSAAIILISGLY
jgi:hypothetical protein